MALSRASFETRLLHDDLMMTPTGQMIWKPYSETRKSPNYPLPYPPDFDCSWTIGSNPTDSITLTAGNSF